MPKKSKKQNTRLEIYPLKKGRYNLIDASDLEIVSLGFPSPPQTILLHEMWRKIYASDFHLIPPEFTHRKRKKKAFHSSRKKITDDKDMYTWCGSLLNDGSNYKSITSSWIIPDIQVPVAGEGNNFFCSIWVGIGGLNGTNLIQAGIDHDITVNLNGSTPSVYFWYEWTPDVQKRDLDFKVAVGDSVSFIVEVVSETQFMVHFANHTQKYTITPFTLTATGGQTLNVQSAEWVVERPKFNGVNTQLPVFKNIVFTQMSALTDTSLEIQGGTGNLISMIDDVTNNDIATATQLSASEINVNYKGPQ
jgi:hypothetical protein